MHQINGKQALTKLNVSGGGGEGGSLGGARKSNHTKFVIEYFFGFFLFVFVKYTNSNC